MATEALLLLGPDLEVVVHGGELTVEGEREVGLRFEHVEDAVDEVDELHPERLEGPIPLPVPVGVRNEVDGRRFGLGMVAHRSLQPTGSRHRLAYVE
jgi:hypothetical protein